jgi:senataxin
MVRQSLVHARSGTASARAMHAAASKPIPKEIHPARPAGFNPRKPVRPSASVATGDDPQDDSDSEDEGLFEKEKAAEKRPVRNILKDNRSTPVLQPIPRAPSISDKEKEQQRMRQRLNINLNPLYKTVLSWDYHSESAYPDAKRDYAAVKDAFGSVTEYQQVLEPLLMLECWQGIQRAKAEGASKNTPFKVTIGKRVSVDSFTDIYASVLKSAAVAANLTDSDLIVLTYYPGRAETAKHPSSSQPYCMAKIKEISSANPEYFDLVLRTYEPLKMLPFLGQKFESHGFRISRYVIPLTFGPHFRLDNKT